MDKTTVIVNGETKVVQSPIRLLKNLTQLPTFGANLSITKRRMKNISPHLFIGGIYSNDYNTTIPGFIGCIAGLVVDGKSVELKSLLKGQNSSVTITGNVESNCEMYCDKNPCSNGGKCFEDWSNNKTLCDCELTSFEGEKCDEDIGILLNGLSSVSFFSFNSTSPKHNVYIRFSYSMNSEIFKSPKLNSKTFLSIVFGQSSDYITIAMLTSGEIFIEEKVSNQKKLFITRNCSPFLGDIGYLTREQTQKPFLE
ncbi:axotactin-like protein [Leptotrombidium deliense]|uniref:Axotactin-like protein n=1 Tax=Leptotrombidium deliense TaxID=299467 RepID=A0A443SRI2_9ACAR|nr:axotactin-like protein [Leptotrombidium deliense]